MKVLRVKQIIKKKMKRKHKEKEPQKIRRYKPPKGRMV
jgi:hypothetical protein